MKENNKGRFFLTLFPNGEYLLAKNSIKAVAEGQGLHAGHISGCLNHPETNHSHRGYKFIWMDKRIKRVVTAYRHAQKYVKQIV